MEIYVVGGYEDLFILTSDALRKVKILIVCVCGSMALCMLLFVMLLERIVRRLMLLIYMAMIVVSLATGVILPLASPSYSEFYA